MSRFFERIYNGIIKENPILIQTLGMCPTLAVTTSLINGIGMGLSSTMVLIASNILISLLKKFIPNTVRIPAYIVVIASLVTIVQFVLQGFVPELYSSLGIYIPLIVVNCIILGRAEAFASKNGVLPSIGDAIGMGLGFTMALGILGFIRELIGNGTIASDGANALVTIPGYTPASIAILAPGAFFVLAFMIAVMNKIKKAKGMPPAEVPDYTKEDGCTGCAAVGICRPDKAALNAEAEAKAKAAAAKVAAAKKETTASPGAAGAKPAQVEQQEKKTVGEAVAAAKKPESEIEKTGAALSEEKGANVSEAVVKGAEKIKNSDTEQTDKTGIESSVENVAQESKNIVKETQDPESVEGSEENKGKEDA